MRALIFCLHLVLFASRLVVSSVLHMTVGRSIYNSAIMCAVLICKNISRFGDNN